jgi:4-hydroxy-2-oxoheptanedioate aldolase
MINSATDAARLVDACRYAPLGSRSFGPNRAGFLGSDYVQTANQTVVPFAMIETQQALENLESILSVDGLHAIYVGPADLSLSLGYAPKADPTDTPMINAVEHIVQRARDKGVIAGIHTGSPAGALNMIAKGFQFVSLPNDRIMLETAARKMLGDVRAGQDVHTSKKPQHSELY